MSISVNHDWWKYLFDEVYLLTDARSVCDPTITSREVDLVCELLPLKPRHRILDLCGGHGRHSLELCSRGITGCTLVDYSQFLVDCARKRAARSNFHIECIRADARKTGLPEDSFDHVLIMGNSLGYIEEPDADLQILAEAHRVLHPGGCVLVDVVNWNSVKNSFNPSAWYEIDTDIVVCRQREFHGTRLHTREMVISKEKGLIRDQTYSIQFYEPENLSGLLTESGFRRIIVRTEFSPHEKKGDYGCMNHRMLARGTKP